jgi:hypothetical protein
MRKVHVKVTLNLFIVTDDDVSFSKIMDKVKYKPTLSNKYGEIEDWEVKDWEVEDSR